MPTQHGEFDLWIARRRAQREQREQERLQILKHLIDWLDAHGHEHGVDELMVFGSLTRPYGFGRSSDVDIAVATVDWATQHRLASAIEGVTGRDVDVVPLEECRFATSIVREGVRWRRPS